MTQYVSKETKTTHGTNNKTLYAKSTIFWLTNLSEITWFSEVRCEGSIKLVLKELVWEYIY